MTTPFPLFNAFMAFVIERQRIYERRLKHPVGPWTKDPILCVYRFCNVYREQDRVTRWIATHWRTPYRADDNLWFLMVIARLINHPATLQKLEWHGRWNREQFLHVIHRRQNRGEKAFGSAYIVSTNGRSMDKAEYLAKFVLGPMWKNRLALRPRVDDRLRLYHHRLIQYQGMGTFMAAQIIADLKYTPPLEHAKDWWTFAASGPGSRRGMSYVMGFDPKMRWKEHEWKDALDELAVLVRPHLKDVDMPRMHAQDLQNCLCEFSKYRRTQLGTGKPKQKFTPHGE